MKTNRAKIREAIRNLENPSTQEVYEWLKTNYPGNYNKNSIHCEVSLMKKELKQEEKNIKISHLQLARDFVSSVGNMDTAKRILSHFEKLQYDLIK